jgi:hypothetical protein
MDAMIALSIVGLAAILLLGFRFWRRRSPAVLRPIDAYARLQRAVGLAVEEGTRLHVSIGRGSLTTTRGGSALAALGMLRRLAERTSASDRPAIVTSGDAALAILSQDTLEAGYRAVGAQDQYRYSMGRLAGLTPFSYAAGTMSMEHDEDVSANVVLGDLGPESGLIAEASDRENASLVAASDDLTAQTIFFISAQEPLIGEELFAAGAYIGAGAAHDASLHVQDILRWLVILAILAGALLRFLGII